MIALEHARYRGLEESERLLANLQRALVDHLADHWDEPDNGLWEIRGPLRHFTHSRAMVWAAFDRAIRGVEEHGLPGPVERWRALRDAGPRRGADEGLRRRGATPSCSTTTRRRRRVAALTLSSIGLVDGDDPACSARSGRSSRTCMRDGLVLRYRTERGRRAAGRRAPLPRLLLLARHGVRTGGYVARRRRRSWIGSSASPTTSGCCRRSTTRRRHRMVGNYPQAFSHLALVGAAARAEASGDATVKA